MAHLTESTTVVINGRDVLVEWTRSAAAALVRRETPIYVELELYFSCLVKKLVHFREDSRGKAAVAAGDMLRIYFRPVTSTACTFEVAEHLGRQPEMEIDSEALRRVAPRHVFVDHVDGVWRGSFAL